MDNTTRDEGVPPGGGRQDHYAMRGEAMHTDAPVPEPIPGERDATTLTHRQPGAIGGQFSGADTPSPDSNLMDEETARLHRVEGGGHS